MVSASQDALRASQHSFFTSVLPVLHTIANQAYACGRTLWVWETASILSERARVVLSFAINRIR